MRLYRPIAITLLSIVAILLIAAPVLAYLYQAPVAIVETNGTAYTMLPVRFAANNTYMAANGFMLPTGLDTRVTTFGGTELPHLVADDKTLTAVPVPASSQTNLYYSTGNSALASMATITGVGGYVTTADDPALEFSNNFVSEFDGYVDTTAGAGKNLLNKTDAVKTFVSSASTITSEISDTTTYQNSAQDIAYSLGVGGIIRVGQRYDSFPAVTLTQVSLYLKKTASPTGIATLNIRKASDDSLIGTMGTINVATLGGAFAWYSFSTEVINPALQNVRILLEYSDGDAVNNVNVGARGADVALGKLTYYVAAYTDINSNDTTIKANIAYRVSVNPVTSGEHNIRTALIIGTFSLVVDGGAPSSIAYVGSVPNNANNWVIGATDVLRYITYYKHTVSGTLVLHYQPVAIVLGTTLPDRAGAAQNGVITWGSNPAGVTPTMGSFVGSGQAPVGVTADDTPRDILAPVAVSDWFGDGSVSSSTLSNPLRPLIRLMSDNTTVTEIQVWRLLGMAMLLLITVGCARVLRGHQGITVMVASSVLIGLSAFDHSIFPFWLIILGVGGFVGGLIAERSPSL